MKGGWDTYIGQNKETHTFWQRGLANVRVRHTCTDAFKLSGQGMASDEGWLGHAHMATKVKTHLCTTMQSK